MAGDWIKVEEGMPDKPEVYGIAAKTGIEPDAVAGKLIRVWAWASRNCNADGVTSVTAKYAIDRAANVTGFADAMVAVGWLHIDGELMTLPNFDRHCSQTAKQRANANRRVARHRGKCNDESVTHVTPQTLPNHIPEKRREEYNTNLASADAKAVKAEKKPRERNPVIDALATIDGSDVTQLTKSAWGQAAKALSEIREVNPTVTAEEIIRRGVNYRTHFKDALLTSTALAKHWAKCANPYAGTNQPEIVAPVRLGRNLMSPRELDLADPGTPDGIV